MSPDKDQSVPTLEVIDSSNIMLFQADLDQGRIMMSGRCRADDSSTAVKLIYNAMVTPIFKANAADSYATFHMPRRPRFLIIDPKLKHSYSEIKRQVIELTGVPVRLACELSYTEAYTAVEETSRIDADATYMEGFRLGPTAAIVNETLPLKTDEVWKTWPFPLPPELDSEEGYVGLLIKDVTNQPTTLVGQGSVYPCTRSGNDTDDDAISGGWRRYPHER